MAARLGLGLVDQRVIGTPARGAEREPLVERHHMRPYGVNARLDLGKLISKSGRCMQPDRPFELAAPVSVLAGTSKAKAISRVAW